MKYDLTKYAPAGIPIKNEIRLFFISLGIACIYSMGFLIRYLDARNELFETTLTGQKVLIISARMPHFSTLIANAFFGFFLAGLLALAASIYHYFFHSQGSKSIYLMKRLPRKWELYKRCFALPGMAILITVLTALLLYLLYYGIYVYFTPSACLPAGVL